MTLRSASESDEHFMQLALVEARKGRGKTSPNPAVGAVICKDGQVLASGWHHAAGRPHAEIEALAALKSRTLAAGATLYVTLEPCSTHGRTPPCTQAILEAGIARVVFGATDPNPLHAGRAQAILEQGGLVVRSGVLAEACAAINRCWNKWIRTGLPYVTAKAGMSLDGRIASPPGRRWITSEAARRDAMKLRATCGAILVGGATARIDNPRLTVRGRQIQPHPWRVVWSRSGEIAPDAHLLTDEHRDRTLVFAGHSLRDVLGDLGRRGVEHVLIEGGGHTLGEAFEQALVDRVVFYIAPVLIGGPTLAVGGLPTPSGIRLGAMTCRRVGGDLRLEAEVA